MRFKISSKFKPTGDQPQAIEKLTNGILSNQKYQVLLGVTGSGKTFTVANVIQKTQLPTLVISHNKTLAAQLYQELRDFFPKNAVSYFVSYYDYYQPEAYVPTTDTYIAKETEINEEIDKLRLAATTNILTRSDTIVVASVSCIYNLGSPKVYGKFILELTKGVRLGRSQIFDRLLDLMYVRNDYNFKRGTFRVRGETVEIQPAYEEFTVRLSLDEQNLKKIELVDPINGNVIDEKPSITIYPAKHYLTDSDKFGNVFNEITYDLKLRVEELKRLGKNLEAERLLRRTEYDLKMIREIGYVNGIENYSRYFDGREPGEAPYSLLEYYKEAYTDWLLIIDESHMSVPQLRGMYNGDKARKQTLIDFGFRLPSALDNRPLRFEEFIGRVQKTIFVSATPDDWEISISQKSNVAEQLVRPTGIVDPEIIIKKTEGQIDDLISEIRNEIKKGNRVLVTTLTKRMAEDLTSFLQERDIKVHYLHSDVSTLKRQDILDDLRAAKYDVIVGINLLREGLDLPEVSLVAIIDADKEGFLRSKTSLIQTMGRAARKVNSRVILYADTITRSMESAINEVERRRKHQLEYNKSHNITPESVKKEIKAKLIKREEAVSEDIKPLLEKEFLFPDEKKKVIRRLRVDMQEAAKMLDFETAAILRDKIRSLQE